MFYECCGLPEKRASTARCMLVPPHVFKIHGLSFPPPRSAMLPTTVNEPRYKTKYKNKNETVYIKFPPHPVCKTRGASQKCSSGGVPSRGPPTRSTSLFLWVWHGSPPTLGLRARGHVGLPQHRIDPGCGHQTQGRLLSPAAKRESGTMCAFAHHRCSVTLL